MTDEVINAEPDLTLTAEVTEPSPLDAVEKRLAQIESTQQVTARQLQQINAAVGRAQSLADKFDKTGDPKVEDKVRAAMADVYEVLGTVSDTLDPAILPETTKARVNTAREAARKASTQADIDRQINERIEATKPQPTADPNEYSLAVEAAVVAEVSGLGLDPDDKAFDWKQAADLLHGAGGLPAMWKYIRTQERTLLTNAEPARPRVPASPAPAGATNNNEDVLLKAYAEDPAKLTATQRQAVEKVLIGYGVLR